MPEEKQNQQNTAEENTASTLSKQEVVENTPAIEETIASNEISTEKQITESQAEQIETELNQEEISEVVEIPKEETVEEVSQTETIPKTEDVPQVEKAEETQTQLTSQPQQPQVIEKIIYQTPPRDTSSEVNGQANFIQNLLNKARAKIQERKRKKLDKILSLFETKSQITNSDIQKLLRVSRATAKRYMDILEKENKVVQIGSVGKGVFYSKKQ